jgi:hypothetical protein
MGGGVLVAASFVGGAACWQDSTARVVRIETNNKHSLRGNFFLDMFGLLGRDFSDI